jgi:hypothetical protein
MLAKNTPLHIQKAAIEVAAQAVKQLAKKSKPVLVLFKRTLAGTKQRRLVLRG